MIVPKSIGYRIQDITNKSDNIEKLKEFLPIWRESYKLTTEMSEKSFIQLVFFFLLFALIDRAEVTKASLFGIEFNSLSVPYIILFVLSVLSFYRLISLICFAQLIEAAIRQAYYRCYQEFQTSGLTELTIYPSLPQVESTFENLERDKPGFFGRVALTFMVLQSNALVIIPLLSFVWASYALITSSLIKNHWSIAVVSASWLIIFRALILVKQILRYAG